MFEEEESKRNGNGQPAGRARGTDGVNANAGKPSSGKLRLEKIDEGQTLEAINNINEKLVGKPISVTEVTSTRKTKVKWPGALIKIDGMKKSVVVIFPDSGVKLSQLRTKMQLLASDAFDRLYKEVIVAAGGEHLDDMVTVLSIHPDKEATLTQLINGLIEEFNADSVTSLAKFSKDSSINISMDFCPGDSVSTITGFPITKQFDIVVDVRSMQQKIYSMHTIDDVTLKVGGYTRPLIVNVTENQYAENGQVTTIQKLKFDTMIILNDIEGETQTVNKLLTGVLGVIATNQSLPSLMGNVCHHESPDISGIEHLANPNVKNENPLHSLRPDKLAERLDNIFTNKQSIAVEVALCTLPELYYILNDIHMGNAETIEMFYDKCEETFGVRPPAGLPIFLKERIEYPVGIINTENGKTPLTSLSPSRWYEETGDELGMLKLMNSELGIANEKPAIEEHINVIADVIGDAVMYERGLRYQFSIEFLQYIMAATSSLRLEVDNQYIVEPSIKLGMNNFAIQNTISLAELTKNLAMGTTQVGGYHNVGAHPIFQPRVMN